MDVERIRDVGAKLRCTKCSAVFLVRAPRPKGETPERREPWAPPTQESPQIDRERLVLVADSSEERGKQSASAIASWGLVPHLVNDGVEAMLAIQRMLPQVVVLDAALPKMFGFQICEVVKRNESLKETTVILVGAIHDQERYRRDPSELYGADVYLEQPDLPDGLWPLLRDAGLPVREAEVPASAPGSSAEVVSPPIAVEPPSVSAPPTPSQPEAAVAPPPARDELSSPIETAPAQPQEEDPERVAEREHAERLARIAVSEMILYQPEKFDEANRAGTLEQVLDLEIQEARALLRQRISEEVCGERDFVTEELRRVAAGRGDQG
ncbi:MAG: response regulator [Deltaproteobacteria bacterium]|nr:response regulator [Deltaproteobacteria bacterium]MBW2501257.1 response regulator [Deltaproteobacteria bacterium]